MARCPNCGKEIRFLKNYVHSCSLEYVFNGDRYEFIRCVYVGGSPQEFCCPECGYKITEDEQEAKKFLKG